MLELVEKIREHAAANAVAPAICGLEGYISYFELQERIAVIGNYLADRRVPLRSKVYLNIANADLRLITTIACLHYGLIPIMIARPPENGEIDCDLVIAAPEQIAAELRPDLVIDETVLDGKFADRQLREFEPRAEDEIFYIGATTGTTGKRKFVAQIYGRFLRSQEKQADPFSPRSRVMFTLADQNIAGFFYALRVFRSNATLVRAHPSAKLYLQMINLFAVDRLITVPKTLDEFMDLMEKNSIRCPSVKRINITGSLFPRQLIDRIERLFDAELWVAYGTSEVGGMARGRVTAEDYVPGYVGKIDADRNLIAETGTAGEPGTLAVENDGLLIKPYYENGKLIRDESPFYRLPDVGYIKDGNLYIVGRDDEVYNFSGMKVPFSTIEALLREHGGIADVAIISDPSRENPLDLLIALVVRGPVDADGLIKDVCGRLGMKAAQPHIRMVQTDAIARNEMGKVDRQAILKLAQPERSTAPAGSPSLNGGGA